LSLFAFVYARGLFSDWFPAVGAGETVDLGLFDLVVQRDFAGSWVAVSGGARRSRSSSGSIEPSEPFEQSDLARGAHSLPEKSLRTLQFLSDKVSDAFRRPLQLFS